MRVYLGSDHAGYALKTHLIEHLGRLGHDPVDCGPHEYDPDDDYPPYCIAVAARVAAEPDSLGVVIGGSGNGEQIAANKVRGVRAALAWNEDTARLARLHNDANVVGIGARMHSADEAARLVEAFVGTAFSGDERHARRLRMISDYETTGSAEPGEAAADGGVDELG